MIFYDPLENKLFISRNMIFLIKDYVREHITNSQVLLDDMSRKATESNKSQQPILIITIEELRTISELQKKVNA